MKKENLKAEDVIKSINEKLQSKRIVVSYRMTGFYFENRYTIYANLNIVSENLTYREVVKELSTIERFLNAT